MGNLPVVDFLQETAYTGFEIKGGPLWECQQKKE
jgi:hypothetical protein